MPESPGVLLPGDSAQGLCQLMTTVLWIFTNLYIRQNNDNNDNNDNNEAYDSSTRFLVCVTVMFHNPADGSCAERAHVGSARRRMERRLRSWLRHERMTVRMGLAAALHHS